jgi:UDP-N-acetylmuramoylalanine--D-glutamate ligase
MLSVREKSLELKAKRVLVVGLGKSGFASSLFTTEQGALTVATDIKRREELPGILDPLEEKGIRVIAGKHPVEEFLASDLIVVSPGVPLTIEPLRLAREKGIRIIGEVELACRFLKGKIIGITGSNGKTTTTALIAWIFSSSGKDCKPCGNIGSPLTELIPYDSPEKSYALELSSFQLETIEKFKPSHAILLNISPDHLDRYDRYDDYVAAKFSIFRNQEASDIAIWNADDHDTKMMSHEIKAEAFTFSSTQVIDKGAYLKKGSLFLRLRKKEEYLMDAEDISIPGLHNVENVLAACIAARLSGIETSLIRAAVMSFKGLPHRLERITTIRGISFYNDSKATNVASAIQAIRSFPGKKIVLILGGRDKGGDFKQLIPLIQNHVKKVMVTGEAREKIHQQIEGSAPVMEADSVPDAALKGLKAASTGDIVLLSPACASFDAYNNYEERGDDFRNHVLELKEEFENA